MPTTAHLLKKGAVSRTSSFSQELGDLEEKAAQIRLKHARGEITAEEASEKLRELKRKSSSPIERFLFR